MPGAGMVRPFQVRVADAVMVVLSPRCRSRTVAAGSRGSRGPAGRRLVVSPRGQHKRASTRPPGTRVRVSGPIGGGRGEGTAQGQDDISEINLQPACSSQEHRPPSVGGDAPAGTAPSPPAVRILTD